MAPEQTGHPSPADVSDTHEGVPNPPISRADPDAAPEQQFVVGAPTEEPREFPGITNAHVGSDGQWQPARQGTGEEEQPETQGES